MSTNPHETPASIEQTLSKILAHAEKNIKNMSPYKKRLFNLLSSELRALQSEKNNADMGPLIEILKTLLDQPDSVLFSSNSPIIPLQSNLQDPELFMKIHETFSQMSLEWNMSLFAMFAPWLMPLATQLFDRYRELGNNPELEPKPILLGDTLVFGLLFFFCERRGMLGKKVTEVVRPVYDKFHSLFLDPAIEGFSSLYEAAKRAFSNSN